MDKKLKQASKLISFWLRHNPSDAHLTLDAFGWTATNSLLQAVNRRLHLSLNEDALIELNNSFDKIRWKIDPDKKQIKATHGHSVPVQMEENAQQPPEVLFHGTATRFLGGIAQKGIISQSRQFVHLSETQEQAIEVGSRHGSPAVIEIKTKTLQEQGWLFFKTSEKVWLCRDIPAEFLDLDI